MITTHLLPNLIAFLLTYIVHSTLILFPACWILSRYRICRQARARIQLWKLAFLMPLFTALTVAATGSPHFGPQISLMSSSAESQRTAVTVPDYSGILPQPGLRGSGSFNRDSSSGPSSVSSESHLSHSLADQPLSEQTLNSSTGAGKGTALIILLSLWFTILVAGLLELALQWRRLGLLRSSGRPVADRRLVSALNRLTCRLQIRRPVSLLYNSQLQIPLTAGILSPFILFPHGTRSAKRPITSADSTAILAHELGHVSQCDAMWNLLLQIICRVFFFQPLNWIAMRQIRQLMDFVADELAANALEERSSLVHCLLRFGERISSSHPSPDSSPALASGMASFESILGQRVEALLNSDIHLKQLTTASRVAIPVCALITASAMVVLAPRAVAQIHDPSVTNPADSPSHNRTEPMNNNIASLVVLTGLAMPVAAEEKPVTDQPVAAAEAVTLKTTPDELPEGIQKFNGMLVGRIAAKDVEKGTFTVLVDAVPRVWENSKAEAPRSIVGKTVQVGGVFGKFLDVLVVTRVGETVEFECKHDGERLVFPGEMLRKVAAYDPADYPVLPEEFRGFQGQVAAEIIKKDPETFELIIRVNRVVKTWDASKAREAQSIVGKQLMLAGFWNRKDAYHELKVGDRIEVGMKHVGMRSEHLTVAEGIRKVGGAGDRPETSSTREEDRNTEGQAAGPRGFRGMLVGRLTEKDVERGTFTIAVDAVPRVWENNRARNPKSLIGQNVSAEGVTGRMIDALVVAKVGDTIEFGALHEEGPRVRVGEVLRKVSPVKPGDYPVLPEEFRGFRGMVTARVIRKGDEHLELIVEVLEIGESFDGSRAENPKSIIGKQAMLAGFWNRKDAYHSINVGDTIQCGLSHQQPLSDHVNVIESVKKVEPRK